MARDRRARRSPRGRRSASRSRSASRERARSRRGERERRRRSASRSRSRSRSRRSRREERRRRERSRSRSRERERKRRRRGSDERRRSASRERARERKEEEKATKATVGEANGAKADSNEPVAVVDGAVKTDGDVVMEEVAAESSKAESVVAKIEVQVEKAKVEAETPTNEVEQAASVSEPQETEAKPKASPPAVNTKAIKLDILKALAEARSTIAGIKGVAASKAANGSTSKPTSAQPSASNSPTTVLRANGVSTVVETPPSPTKLAPPSPKKQVVPSPKKESPQKNPASAAEEFDMFAATDIDDEDMVAPASAPVVPTVDVSGLQLNCDDPEGYYNTTVGEILNGKYRVLGSVGKGVFSTVLRCQCVPPLQSASGSINVVAVKLIRNNDVMRDAAQTEVRLLNELAEKDPRDKKHCVRLLDTFSHRNHVALVFEPMQMNLREAMKKFGGKGGISIQAVRVFSKHLLIALNHLETCGIIHADIKPDNILLDEKQTTIKLCDFGSAFKVDDGKQDPTPYLVSRFYRAPEIVLGLAYDKAVDMWSVGCCLFEMFTGKVMFPGSTNNEMLKLCMELKGKIPNKLIKKHRQAYIDQFQIEPHFTEDMKFCSRETDRVTGKPLLRVMENIKTKNDLAGALMAAKSATDDRKLVLELKSLLDRMFTLDPSKRITVREALAHPFIKG